MFNPFDEKPMPISETIMDWETIYPKAYNKMEVDPYTKVRIILMNGIEVESALFTHQFLRNCNDNDLRREISMLRKVEQQQQKVNNWLSPKDETPLEVTIGYEHVAVDLTAWLAQNEPDPYVKQALDFALLEDFDHLYRYANLLDLDENIPAERLVKGYVEGIPGRPTIAEHLHPYDSVRNYVDFTTADIRTKLNTLIITSAEQQTMNWYMNIGSTYYTDLGRQLYQEIALIEEQHVTHYGSLLDPNCTWLENLVLHEYMECYLYYSFYQDEQDQHVKAIWERHLAQEITHLHKAVDLLAKYENKNWQQVVSGPFPKLLKFQDTKDYVRKIMAEQTQFVANRESYTNINNIPDDHTFFWYQDRVNHDIGAVASHVVVAEHQRMHEQDYRWDIGPHPVKELQERTQDNTTMSRTKSKQPAHV